MLLSIQKKRLSADVVVLEMAGRITLGRECQQVEREVEGLIRESEKRVIFDFSKLDLLDSTGIGILVMCSGKLKRAGGELRLAGAKGMVEQVLRMTNVDRIVTLYPTPEAAAEKFTSGSPLGPPA